MEGRIISWPQLQAHSSCSAKPIPFPTPVRLVPRSEIASKSLIQKKEPVVCFPNDPSKATFLAKFDSSNLISSEMPVLKDWVVQ